MNGLEQLRGGRGSRGLGHGPGGRVLRRLARSFEVDGTRRQPRLRVREGGVLHVYLSPEHTGGSTATLASPYVGGIEAGVDELTANGVVFERYDQAPIFTDDKGIATFDGGEGRVLQRSGRQHALNRSGRAFVVGSRGGQQRRSGEKDYRAGTGVDGGRHRVAGESDQQLLGTARTGVKDV